MYSVMSHDCKRKVVILTSAQLCLDLVGCLMMWVFHLESSTAVAVFDIVMAASSLALIFWAWTLVARAGLGWKWRFLVLAFGPFAALMLPVDSHKTDSNKT